MHRPPRLLAIWFSLAMTVGLANAQSTPQTATAPLAQPSVKPSDVVLAENSKVKLTLADYQTELLNLAPEMRGAFATDPKRVATLLNNLLTLKTLAAEARDAKLDREPEAHQRIALESDRVLAGMQVQHLEEKLGKEYDAKSAEFTTRAREIYLVDKSKYTVPAQVEISHILFANTRGDAAALAAAKDARAKIVAGEDFAALARTLSDDKESKEKGGSLGWHSLAEIEPTFGKAAFALQKVGEISEPVSTPFGWHLIRLDGRRPAKELSFDEAKPQILADLRTQYVSERRDAALNAIRNDPAIKANQAAIDALVQRPVAATPGAR